MKLRKLAKILRPRRVIRFLRDAWLLAGITLLMFLLLELAVGIAFRFMDSGPDSRAQADTYVGQTWPQEYFEEFEQAHTMRWAAYVYYRHRAFDGDYINVTEDGVRLGTDPETPTPSENGQSGIFVFGGSALWGAGARDEFTIPALLEKELLDSGMPCDVVNFGESGWVSTQEVIQLLLQLQQGNIPDLVVFYDGVNDTFAAMQMNVAGVPQNEFNRNREFNMSSRLIRYGADDLSTVRLAKYLGKRAGLGSGPAGEMPQPGIQLPAHSQLSTDVATVYFRNMEIVLALAEHYQFETLFYLQPTIFDKQPLTLYEQTQHDNQLDVRDFFADTYETIRDQSVNAVAPSRFKDLSRVFASSPQPLFIDWCHLGETGNQLIAEKIANDILDLHEVPDEHVE